MNGQMELTDCMHEIDNIERRKVNNRCETCQYEKHTVIIHWHDNDGKPKDIIKKNWIHENCLKCQSWFCKVTSASGIDKDHYKKTKSMYQPFRGKYDTVEIDRDRAEKLKEYNAF